jgi:hypothetical protein
VAHGERPHTLTLAFAEYVGSANDESPLAEQLAAQFGTRHATVMVRKADFIEEQREQLLAAMDQPSIDGVNTWFVSQAAASQGIKVALSGLGGDELFASYPSFADLPPSISRWRLNLTTLQVLESLSRLRASKNVCNFHKMQVFCMNANTDRNPDPGRFWRAGCCRRRNWRVCWKARRSGATTWSIAPCGMANWCNFDAGCTCCRRICATRRHTHLHWHKPCDRALTSRSKARLSFHGWIPEAVPLTLSVLPGRRRVEVDHGALGLFRFCPLALRQGHFLEAVDRHTFAGQAALVAQPLRALMDIACQRKLEPGDSVAFVQSMRIDAAMLMQIPPATWQALQQVYAHNRTRASLQALHLAFAP